MEKIDEHTVYLSLGSNQGDRIENLQRAIELIQARIGILKQQSRIYQTPPLGFEAEMDFLNCCIEITTTLNPTSLLAATQKIELDLGRKQTQSGVYTSRTIDIDTILYDNLVDSSQKLNLPHPRFRDRKFVLEPMCELNKNGLDPITNLTMKQLLANCGDPSELKVYHQIKK